MDESQRLQLTYDKILCIFHTKGSFLDDDIQVYSIFQELCYIYKTIMNLNIEFSYSLNKSYNNIIVDNLPTIIYGKNIIRKTNIPNFFKVLTGIDRELEKNDLQTKMYFEMIEKIIYSDLQMLLNYYCYLYNQEKSSLFWKVIRSFYSPIQSIVSNYNDSKISREISRILNVFTREESLEQIKQINLKLETFLASFGEAYYNNLTERNLNSLDFAIYAAIKTQKSVLNNKFIEDKDGLRIQNQSYKILGTFLTNFDNLILTKIKIKNSLWSLTAVQYEEFCPKPNFVDTNFNNYPEIINISDEDYKSQLKIKMILSSCFIGFLVLSKYLR